MTNEQQTSTLSGVPGTEAIPQAAMERNVEEASMSNKWSHTMTAFLLGAATGGIAALLFAPTSGRELRGKIGESSDKLRTAADEKAREAREKVVEKYQETTERARGLAAGAKESADTYRVAVKEAFKEGKAAYDREVAKAG
jgi:gas vesicle protein